MGDVNAARAAVIADALDALRADLEAELLVKAEAHLVGEAGHFGPRDLRRIGGRLLEAIAPDLADEQEHQRLVAAERRAQAATRLTFHPRGDGSTDVHARVPDHVAGRLPAYVDAIAAPRRTTPAGAPTPTASTASS